MSVYVILHSVNFSLAGIAPPPHAQSVVDVRTLNTQNKYKKYYITSHPNIPSYILNLARPRRGVTHLMPVGIVAEVCEIN